MKRYILANKKSCRKFKVIHASEEVDELDDFDRRWIEKFGPDDQLRAYTPEEFDKFMQDVIEFE